MRMLLFYSGTHTAKSGQSQPWPPERVRAMGERYKAQRKKIAAITKGHPSRGDDGAAAYGWLDHSIEVVDNYPEAGQTAIVGNAIDVDPELLTQIRNKNFLHVSLGINVIPGIGDDIDHVAVLGATQPAVPGCRILDFSEMADGLVEFTMPLTEYADPLQLQDTPMTPDEIAALSTAITDGVTKGITDALTPQLKAILDAVTAETQVEVDAQAAEDKAKADQAAADAAAAGGGMAQHSAEVAAVREEYSTRIAAIEAENLKLKINGWLDTPEAKKRILPKNRPVIYNRMEKLAALPGVVEFSSGGKTVKGTELEEFQAEIIATWPVIPGTTEFSAAGTGEAIDDPAATTPQERGKSIVNAGKAKATA